VSGVHHVPFFYNCYGKCGGNPDGEITVTMETSGDPAELSSEESAELASDDGGYEATKGICTNSWP